MEGEGDLQGEKGTGAIGGAEKEAAPHKKVGRKRGGGKGNKWGKKIPDFTVKR